MNSYINIPNQFAALRLQTIAHASEGGAVHEYELSTDVHSVLDPGLNQRQLYGFDGFMNHSCDANTYSVNNVEEHRGGRNDVVALRDMAAGEQVWFDSARLGYSRLGLCSVSLTNYPRHRSTIG